MRWNCPHCGSALALADEKIENHWSYSRCYKCGGFALVKRSEMGAIKTESAPAGERVLLPEMSEEPRLSERALKNLLETRQKLALEKAQSAAQSAALSERVENLNTAQATPPPMSKSAQAKRNAQKINSRKVFTAALSMIVGAGVVFAIAKSMKVDKIATTAAKPVVSSASENASIQLPLAKVEAVESSATPQAIPAISTDQGEDLKMQVKVRIKNAILRAGPGQEFAQVGSTAEGTEFPVINFKDRWFQIKASDQTAWIRNDLVEVK